MKGFWRGSESKIKSLSMSPNELLNIFCKGRDTSIFFLVSDTESGTEEPELRCYSRAPSTLWNQTTTPMS